MGTDKGYNDIKNTLDRFRQKLNENNNYKGEAIPYTQQDELLNTTLESAKSLFGADFSEHKTPMLYYPTDGDVVLSGTIPELNRARFQFRYLVDDGCFLWADELKLTDGNVVKISKIRGFWKNWKDQISKSGDIKPIGMQNQS